MSCLFVIIISFTLMNLFVVKKDLYSVFVFSIDEGRWKTVHFQMCMMMMTDNRDGAYEYPKFKFDLHAG